MDSTSHSNGRGADTQTEVPKWTVTPVVDFAETPRVAHSYRSRHLEGSAPELPPFLVLLIPLALKFRLPFVNDCSGKRKQVPLITYRAFQRTGIIEYIVACRGIIFERCDDFTVLTAVSNGRDAADTSSHHCLCRFFRC